MEVTQRFHWIWEEPGQNEELEKQKLAAEIKAVCAPEQLDDENAQRVSFDKIAAQRRIEAQEETEEEDEITSVVPLKPQETQPSDSCNTYSLVETSSPKNN